MPTCYGYGRVSKDEKEQYYSPKAQREKIECYYKSMLADKPDKPVWGDIFFDEASAKQPLCERPAGRLLDLVLKTGDYLVIARVDRAFRVDTDQLITTRRWLARGIKLHFLDLPVADITSPEGQLILGILAQVAQFERARCGQRTKDALEWKHRNGLPASGNCPIGWLRIGKKRKAVFAINEAERRMCFELKAMYDELGSAEKVAWESHKRKMLFRGTPLVQQRVSRILRAIRAEFPLPNGSFTPGRPLAAE